MMSAMTPVEEALSLRIDAIYSGVVSRRAQAWLEANSVETVADLLAVDWRAYSASKNFGYRTQQEIHTILCQAVNFCLNYIQSGWSS